MVKVVFGKIPGVLSAVARIALNVGQKAKKLFARHDIIVIDCSGSTAGFLHDIAKDSMAYVKDLAAADYATVIIFSGHGTAKQIAGPTQMNAQGKRLVCAAIEKHVHVMGTTVFSEPLGVALEAAKAAAGEKLMHHSILFTDGCPVPTQWSDQTERKKALAKASELGSFGALLSAIGYGFYYDEAFLRQLVAANGGNGCYLHISEVEDFSEAINAVKAVAEKMEPVDITITVTTDKGDPSRAFRTTPEVTTMDQAATIRVTAVYDGGAQFFVDLPDGAKSLIIKGKAGGKNLEVEVSEGLDPKSQADYIRVLGVHAFGEGDLATAQEFFEQTGDGALADNLGNAYSDRDVREAGNRARAFFRENKFIGDGLKAAGPNHNVLNALRILIQDPQNVITLPKGVYQRSGVLMKDPRVVENPLGNTIQIVGYVSHQERFNFSVRARKNVMILPENGNGGAAAPMQIWRTYNIILDGNLRTPELIASLAEESFTALQAAGCIEPGTVWKAGVAYTLNLRGLKMTSPAWANPTTLRLVDMLKDEQELEAEQKALNARKKDLATGGVPASGEEGIYRESAKPVDGVVQEFYQAPCCDYRLMKYKPKAYDCSGMDFTQADERVKVVRQLLIRVRFMIRSIIFSMEATKSRAIRWNAPTESIRSSVAKIEQTAEFGGAALKRVTWTEQVVCS